MYSYIAYGLGIRSTLPLPELVAREGPEDVVVRLGRVDRMPSVLDPDGGGFWAAADEACRFVSGVGSFLVRGGREIIVDPLPGIEDRVVRLPILGPVLAILLHQRGRFVLHASAVAWGGEAVVVTGGSGWGKSTLAAALHARGCGIVADDVTAIAMEARRPAVLPGFPLLKLWPDAVVSLGESPETMPCLHPLLEKRARKVTRGFSSHLLPLRCIYVLAEGPFAAVEPLRPRAALIELVGHWYGARFGDRLFQGDSGAASHFQHCASLASRVPVRRLTRPRSASSPLDLANRVEADLAQQFEDRFSTLPVAR